MDFVQFLPLQILEMIFERLSDKELGHCCQVSVDWHEVVNSMNKLWYKICKCRNWTDILNDNTITHYFRPKRHFAQMVKESANPNYTDQFCRWRLIFEKYQWVNKSYQIGKFVKFIFDIEPEVEYYDIFRAKTQLSSNGHLISIQVGKNKIVLWNVLGIPKQIVSLKSALNIDIKNLSILGEIIVFSQLGLIKVLRIVEEKCETIFTKIVGLGADTHVAPHNDNDKWYCENVHNTKELVVKLAKDYIIAAVFSECTIYIWSSVTGELSNLLNLAEKCLTISAMTVYDSMLLVAVYFNNCISISEYSLKTQHWIVEAGWTVNSSESLVREMLVNNLYVLIFFQDTLTRPAVQVWNRQNNVSKTFLTQSDVSTFKFYREYIIYTDNKQLELISLPLRDKTTVLLLNKRIRAFHPVSNSVVVINTCICLEVWDWEHSLHLYTLSHCTPQSIQWCDDVKIVNVGFIKNTLEVYAFW